MTAEPAENLPASQFWGEGPQAGGAPLVGAGRPVRLTDTVFARLREPPWWDGQGPLLLLLRDAYAIATDRAAAALRALPAAGASVRPPAPAGPTDPANDGGQAVGGPTVAGPTVGPPRARPLVLPGMEQAVQSVDRRRR